LIERLIENTHYALSPLAVEGCSCARSICAVDHRADTPPAAAALGDVQVRQNDPSGAKTTAECMVCGGIHRLDNTPSMRLADLERFSLGSM